MSSHSLHSHSARYSRGFGLVELLVSISIMVLISVVVLARQDSFNGAVLLRSEAYEVALQIREVQLFAVSAIGNSGSFRDLYGVHFSTVPGLANTFRVFRDGNGNGYFDAGEQFGRQGSIDGRFEVRELRTFGDTFVGSSLSVVFERPNFDARFYDADGEVQADRLEIDIAQVGMTGSGPEVLRTVEVTSTGQITVLGI